MKVKQLKDLLKNVKNDEMEVVVSNDLNEDLVTDVFRVVVINSLSGPIEESEKLVISTN